MYPAKVMTAGEGGFIVTNNKNLRDKLLMIRNHGMVHGYDTRMFGSKFKIARNKCSNCNCTNEKTS